MATADQFKVTQRYGYDPSYPLNGGQHRGTDYGCPKGTLVVVNGVTIGVSGDTGKAYGAHLHVGKFTQNGTVLDSTGAGFLFGSARVISTGFDASNGNYVKILGDSYVWVYCHLDQIRCTVGQQLPPPIVKTKPRDEDDIMISNSDNEYGRWNKLFCQIRGRNGSREEFVNSAVGKSWLRAMEILSDGDEADGTMTAQSVGQVAIRDNWQGQIEKLLGENTSLKSALATLTDDLSKATIELNDLKVKYLDIIKQVDVPVAIIEPEVEESKPSLSDPQKKPEKASFWVTFIAALLHKK